MATLTRLELSWTKERAKTRCTGVFTRLILAARFRFARAKSWPVVLTSPMVMASATIGIRSRVQTCQHYGFHQSLSAASLNLDHCKRPQPSDQVH